MRMDSSGIDPAFGATAQARPAAPFKTTASAGAAPPKEAAHGKGGNTNTAATSESPFARLMRSQAAARQAENAAANLGPDAAALRNTGRRAAVVDAGKGEDDTSAQNGGRGKDSRNSIEDADAASGLANAGNPAPGMATPPPPPPSPTGSAAGGTARDGAGDRDAGGDEATDGLGVTGRSAANALLGGPGGSGGLAKLGSAKGSGSAGGAPSGSLLPGAQAGRPTSAEASNNAPAMGATGAAGANAGLSDVADGADAGTPAGAPKAAAGPETAARPSDGSLPSLGAAADSPAVPSGPSANAADGPPVPTRADLPAPPGSPGFAPALGAQLRTWLRDGIDHARLELHPRELGPIDVRIALQHGRASISLAADLASTRQALSDALPALSAQLGDVGLHLGAAGVSEQPVAEAAAQALADAAAQNAAQASSQATAQGSAGSPNGGGPGAQGDRSAGARLAQAFGRLSSSMGSGHAEPLSLAARTASPRGVLDLFA